MSKFKKMFSKLKTSVNGLWSSFNQTFKLAQDENAFQTQVKTSNRSIMQLTSVGLVLHYIYICTLVAEQSAFNWYTYMNLVGINLPFTLIVASRYLLNINTNRRFDTVLDFIVGVHSVIWALNSLITTYLCYAKYSLAGVCANNSRPINLGLPIYACFGVLVTLLIFRINQLIMLSIVSIFCVVFVVLWSIVTPMPYIVILPVLGLIFFAFFLRQTLEKSERTKFLAASALEKELSANKDLQKHEKLMQDKSKRFVNYVFHELRNHMNTVYLNWEFVQKELHALENCQEKSAIAYVQEGLDGLENLLDEVLDARKMQEGKFTLNNQPFDINKTVLDLYNTTFIAYANKNISLQISIDPALNQPKQMLLGDQNRIKQILNNFLSNSLKFSKSGGMIIMSTRLKNVSQNRMTVYFSVKDDGCGISLHNQQKLFQDFQQVQNFESSNVKGTGLGLAIVASIVDSYQGRKGVISEPGKGAEFWVEIEFEICQHQQNQASNSSLKTIDTKRIGNGDHVIDISESIVPYKNRFKILVADDSMTARKLMQRIIENMGHACKTVSNGFEALKEISQAKESYDILITDIQMPIMNGSEMIVQLRKQNFTLPIIVMTGSADNSDSSNFSRLGANANLTKPVNSKRLANIITAVSKQIQQPITRKNQKNRLNEFAV